MKVYSNLRKFQFYFQDGGGLFGVSGTIKTGICLKVYTIKSIVAFCSNFSVKFKFCDLYLVSKAFFDIFFHLIDSSCDPNLVNLNTPRAFSSQGLKNCQLNEKKKSATVDAKELFTFLILSYFTDIIFIEEYHV